jgi:hypothetical protein
MGSVFGRFTTNPMIRWHVQRAHALRSAALAEAWRLLPLPRRSWLTHAVSFTHAFRGPRL